MSRETERREMQWQQVAASPPDGWTEFVRRMQQVAPPSPSALEFARQAFISGQSSSVTRKVAGDLRTAVGFLRSCARSGEDGADHPMVVDALAAYDSLGDRPLNDADRVQQAVHEGDQNE